MAMLPFSLMPGVISPASVAVPHNFDAFSPSVTAYSPAAHLPGVPFATSDATPGGSHMGYATPSACPKQLGNSTMWTPTEQVKRLRERQQKWEAAAQFFHEQEKVFASSCCMEQSPTSPKADVHGIHSQSPNVKSRTNSPYTPGKLLAKTAECSVAVELDVRSECSTVESAETTSTLVALEPAYVSEHSNVSPDPKFNLDELPSVGSLGHDTGDCKPCAFFYTKGCGNGSKCSFCHLCEAGEKKRRFKAKKAHFNALKEQDAQGLI